MRATCWRPLNRPSTGSMPRPRGQRASMKLGVTGGSGFIGSHVVDSLIDAGHEVSVLDPKPPHRPDAGHRPVSILDSGALADALAGLDAVFHLAAFADVNDVVRDPAGALDLKVWGPGAILGGGPPA